MFHYSICFILLNIFVIAHGLQTSANRISIKSSKISATMKYNGFDTTNKVIESSWSLKLLPKIATFITISNMILSTPNIVYAAIGEGDLPNGAMAFSKLLKYQKDWDALGKSFESRDSTTIIDDREKINLKFFFKQLANEYYDMELLTSGITDTEKANQAKQVAKSIRQEARQLDDLASSNEDIKAKVIEFYPIISNQLKEFFELQRDVPDEI